ncbi:MAG TPA: DNA alkylation repair protein, partial [Gammaproteobacteria bacterium]
FIKWSTAESRLKDQFFNPGFYRQLSQTLARIDPGIDAKKFHQACIKNLAGMELKQRMQHTADVCRQFFPDHYPAALKRLYAYAATLKGNSFSYMFMPDFVARYGTHDFKRSLQALRDFTQYSSSELAIRVFLQHDLERTLAVINKWTDNENTHIRRLASEGTRPRLPWAIQVRALRDTPELCFPILQDLHADNEKYVQKSVANHLNDMSKDHPEKMLRLVKSWDNSKQSTQWIIRHAARTLVKQGHRTALDLFGATQKPQIELRVFRLRSNKLSLGDNLEFELQLVSRAKQPQQLIVDYRIHYVKASGRTSPKVFKLKMTTLPPRQTLSLDKQHPLKNFTTRKHYSGRHQIELLINGASIKTLPFQLDAGQAI